jgi:hypothetical protein
MKAPSIMPAVAAPASKNGLGARLTCAALVTALCMPLQALSWGAEGHQVIAKLAESQLTPKARKEVNRLLALEPDATMASVSTWADEHKGPATAAWHYVNFPHGTCNYVP